MVTRRTQTRINKYQRSNVCYIIREAHFINLATLCSERTLTAIHIDYKLVVCRSRSVSVISKLAVHKSLSNWSREDNNNDKVYHCLTLGKSNTCPVKENNVSRVS
uniref:Uncharacterized protein n=1 Tax=Glossina austeni TaxID=7395 RepID=A0A1A9UVN7_GLOAU